jgi:glutamate-1-semialdehyde 2,1-aminomutase
LAQLRELERIDAWRILEGLGVKLESRLTDAISRKDLTFHRIGSMFCLFFASHPIFDLESAQRSDTKKFAQFFHSCLERSIYFPPSQFETAFISTAHSDEDIEQTARAVREALTRL